MASSIVATTTNPSPSFTGPAATTTTAMWPSAPPPATVATSLPGADPKEKLKAEAELARARELFERAAAQGDGAGMVGLGDCHYFGRRGFVDTRPLVPSRPCFSAAARLGPSQGGGLDTLDPT